MPRTMIRSRHVGAAPATPFIVAALLSGSLIARGQGPSQVAPQVKARLDSIISASVIAGEFSGVVTIADHGQIIYERAEGEANREWKVPMAPNAVFRIGSTSKQFTAALVLLLVEDGALSLDSPISRYLPRYPKPQADDVTIRHLLSHTSGIPEYVTRDTFFVKHAPSPTTAAELIARFGALPLEFAPGSKWSYSNSGYVVLAAIIEAASHTSYSTLLRTRIAEPLGLTSLSVDDNNVIPRAVRAYVNVDGRVTREPHVDVTSAYGAGMLRATARDLVEWSNALDRGRVFQVPETGRQFIAPRISTGTPPGDYAFGLFVGSQMLGGRPRSVVQHGGTIAGFVTGFWRMPQERRAIVVLSNLRSSGTTALIGKLATALYQQ